MDRSSSDAPSFSEKQRLRALDRYDLLDTPPEESFDRLTSLAARLFDVPFAFVTLVDAERVWFKSCHGRQGDELPREGAFCSYNVETPESLVVEDLAADDRFAEYPLVEGEPGFRFYAGVPLCAPEGQVLGSLCLLDDKPRAFSPEEQLILEELAASVMSEMELRREMAERKRFEEASAAMAQRMSRIMGVMEEVFWATTPEGTLQYLSQAAGQVYGRPASAFFEQPSLWHEMVHPEDADAVTYAPSTFDDCDQVEREYRILRPDGAVRHVRERAYATRDAEGALTSVAGMVSDVTRQKRTEVQLHSRDRLLQGVADATQALLSATDLDTAMGEALRLLGRAAEADRAYLFRCYTDPETGEWRSARQHEWSREGSTAPDPSATQDFPIEQHHPGLVEKLINQKVVRGTPDDLPEDGRKWLETHGVASVLVAAVFVKGEFWGYLGFNQEEKERYRSAPERSILVAAADSFGHAIEQRAAERALKENERKLRLAVKAARLGLWEYDLAEDRLEYSGRCHRVFGVASNAELGTSLGSLFERIHPGDHAAVRRAIGTATQQDKVYEVQYRTRRPDGTTGWAHIWGQRVQDGATGKGRLVGIVQDISARKETEAQLRQARDDLERRVQKRTAQLRDAKEAAEQASQAKSMFLANMSHELRTPLNGIQGLTELLSGTETTAKQQQYLGMVQTSADTLLRLINDLLDHAKLEAGKVELNEQPFAPANLLKKIDQIFGTLARKKGIALNCQHDPAIPEVLIGDEGRLEQVLANLVGNALKFTEQGEVTVTSRLLDQRAEQQPNSKNEAALSFFVRDTGIGIPEEKQSQLFDSFSQVDGSLSREHGGTGLGLSISKKLLEAMDGGIQVESTVGVGSTFSFEACFRQPGDDSRPLPREQEAEDASTPQRFSRPHRLLLVEDNHINREVAHEALRLRGARVQAVPDGQEALDALAEHPFDLVLMDVQMPGLDGLEVTRRIRAGAAPACNVQVVALTAHAMEDDRARCLAAGADEYVSKPVDFDALLKVVERLLNAPGEASPEVPAPPADLTRLMDSMQGNPEKVQRIVTQFVDRQEEEVGRLRGGVARGEWETAERLAHGLKSGLGYLGAERARERAAALEAAAQAEEPQAATEALAQVEGEMERVSAYLASDAWRTAL